MKQVEFEMKVKFVVVFVVLVAKYCEKLGLNKTRKVSLLVRVWLCWWVKKMVLMLLMKFGQNLQSYGEFEAKWEDLAEKKKKKKEKSYVHSVGDFEIVEKVDDFEIAEEKGDVDWKLEAVLASSLNFHRLLIHNQIPLHQLLLRSQFRKYFQSLATED